MRRSRSHATACRSIRAPSRRLACGSGCAPAGSCDEQCRLLSACQSTPTPTTVVVFGTDRQQVGLAAARIRDLRRPDAYKGKGVRYAAEVLRLKKGKKK